MSNWGAVVITNLITAIPWIGQDIVDFVLGGFTVNNATLNRFFALHYLLPFAIAALVLMHLIALHDQAGSGNPLGVSGLADRLAFAPYFLFKDLVTIFIFIIVLSVFVFFMPNHLGDSENYQMANPMSTPAAITIVTLVSNNLLDKDQLLKKINDNKETNDKDENFRLLANGLFQAEGHVEGSIFIGFLLERDENEN